MKTEKKVHTKSHMRSDSLCRSAGREHNRNTGTTEKKVHM